ncbi:hypothetical protein [Sphingobacterium sp. 2149]|uniref:hypothetical protein n=1 Tax=Sphingobacterium sp. 2149 TaxID=2817763 RepID=UPI002857FBA8|nr:hypothetical protein [Sphingobacterium sp. 2149]MDR6734132.1 hypothetical protein [Sphingobacterium sp. 2149]
MENQIKVGQSCKVVVITDNSEYPSVYKIGNTGVLIDEYPSGNAKICIGNTNEFTGSWHVLQGCFKTSGKLTVTKVK